jgi:hypothetical protein
MEWKLVRLQLGFVPIPDQLLAQGASLVVVKSVMAPINNVIVYKSIGKLQRPGKQIVIVLELLKIPGIERIR